MTELDDTRRRLVAAELEAEEQRKRADNAEHERDVARGKLVRWRLQLEAAGKPRLALPPAPADDDSQTLTTTATTRRRRRRPRAKRATAEIAAKPTTARDTDEIRAAKLKLIRPALEAFDRGERTWPIFVELASKPITLPGRDARKYTPEALRQWFARARGVRPHRGSSRKSTGSKRDNPQPLPRVHRGAEISKHRRLDCPALKRCGIIAKRNQWRQGFTCDQCEGPGGRHA